MKTTINQNTNAKPRKTVKRTLLTQEQRDDAAVRSWFANTLLSLAETLVATAASAPPSVRRRIGKERHIRHELTESLLPVVAAPGMHDVLARIEAAKFVQKAPDTYGGMVADA
jgi:hypothetical protein